MLYVILGWVGAVLVALAILGFCAYELGWKARRLQTDLGRLQADLDGLKGLQGQLAELQRRAEQSRPGVHPVAES